MKPFRIIMMALGLLTPLIVSPQARASNLEVLKPAAPSEGRPRFALAIGNAAYRNISPLRNAISDAEAFAQALHKLGFTVTLARDLPRMDMNVAITDFINDLPEESDVVVYYAGHGVEVHGANYLLPVDAPKLNPGQDRILRTEAVALSDLLSDFRAAGRSVVFMLDACRDNPFTLADTRSFGGRSIGGTRGLARVEPPRGSFVIYSAAVGEVALDTLDAQDQVRNSLFTRALLPLIEEEGLEIRDLVQRLRATVSAATKPGGYEQMPGYYDELPQKFYFRPKPALDADAALCESGADPAADAFMVMRRDLGALAEACGKAFAQKPEDERLRRLFRSVLEQKKLQAALASSAPQEAYDYLISFPDGVYGALVKEHLKSLRDPKTAAVKPRVEAANESPKITAEPSFKEEKKPDPPAAAKPEAATFEAAQAPPVQADPPIEERLAALTSPNAAVDAPSRQTLARALQTQLAARKCYSGPLDGRWDDESKSALRNFARHAKISVGDEPNAASLDAVKERAGRICPLVCDQGMRAVGERCERVACARNEERNEDGDCVRKAVASERRASRSVKQAPPPPPKVEPVRREETRAVKREKPQPQRSARAARTETPKPAPVEKRAQRAPRVAERPAETPQAAPAPAPQRPRVGIGFGFGGFGGGRVGVGIGF